MKTVSGIVLTIQVLGWLTGVVIAALAAGDDGGTGVLEELRRETAPVLRQTGRPAHLFRLDPSKAALVIIDMQTFSCAPSGEPAMPGIASAVASTNRLADHCRSLGFPSYGYGRTSPAGRKATPEASMGHSTTRTT
jgi:hypothetical protein